MGGAFQRRISVFDSNGNQGRTFKLGDGYECVAAVVTGDSATKLIVTTNATFGARLELQRQDLTNASMYAAGSLDATPVTHAGRVDAEESVLGLVDLPVVTIRDIGEDCILGTRLPMNPRWNTCTCGRPRG